MSRLAERERGSVTSTVVIFPVVMFTILVVIHFALWHHGQNIVDGAAQDAVRAAQLEGGSTAQGEARAQAVLGGAGGLSGVSISVSRGGGDVNAVVSANVQSVVPGLNLRVTGQASGPVEEFRPETQR